MNSECPLSRFSSRMLPSAALAALVLMPLSFAQQSARQDNIPVKNWSMRSAGASAAGILSTSGAGSASGLVYVAITPCRVMDTRGVGGSGNTGAFGPPSLLAGQARLIPIPSSNCGVPAAAAYSLNFVSVTPLGQPVAWIAAWQDDM